MYCHPPSLHYSLPISWPSVSSFGTRPTVQGSSEPLLEAHLFDFEGDLYGRRIEVEFIARLRDELKFDDLPALVAQMHLDAAQARAPPANDINNDIQDRKDGV